MSVMNKTIPEIDPFWGSAFIKGIPLEIEKMNESLGLEMEYTVNQPEVIDGDTLKARKVAFMVKKRPWILKETYCLYALYEDGVLKGFIGRIRDKEIHTLRDLGSLVDLEKGYHSLYKWVQSLIKVACDKI